MWRGAWYGAALLIGISAAVSAAKPEPELIVHEWGTFLAMSGSDGATLDGMYHEEHALPGFVHARSKDQLRLPSALVKGETPVIYFYSKNARSAWVRVDFPAGIWTQWYPQASVVGPSLSSATLPEPKGGHISWQVELQPAASVTSIPTLPATSSDALWRFAREVDADFVHPVGANASEWERFIFYRGLGQSPLPLRFTEAEGGTLALAATGDQTSRPHVPEAVHHLFVVRVENGQGTYRYLPRLTAGASLTEVIPSKSTLRPISEFTTRIGDALAARLVDAGLYPKEARAMVRTWQSSYFETDGIRVLCVMPRSWTDRFIPMQINPRPHSLVRVMVGRVELLTAEREQRAVRAIRDLASVDSKVRDQAFSYLTDLGRFAEPVLRRVLRESTDPELRIRCRRLLLTDFVTELRTATRNADTGARMKPEWVGVQAQLASLLTAVGLHREARETAGPLLKQLRAQPEPSMDRSGSRHYFRAVARASEAMGDHERTTRAYARFIRFGSRVKTCGGCHESEGPKNMAWFRDWWAGRRFASYAAKSGTLQTWINNQNRALASNRNDIAAQMLLAYLYEADGKPEQAASLWERIAPNSRIARVSKAPANLNPPRSRIKR